MNRLCDVISYDLDFKMMNQKFCLPYSEVNLLVVSLSFLCKTTTGLKSESKIFHTTHRYVSHKRLNFF